MLLSLFQDIFEAFKCDSERPRLIHFQGWQKSLDDATVDEGLELMEVGACGAVAHCPDCFFPDFTVIIEEDLYKFVYYTHI